MGHFLLDRSGDARVPEGYTVIDSEVAFLAHAVDDGRWLIRGGRLCEWAETFLAGRRISWQEALSPCHAIQAAVPGLSPEQAAELFARLEAQFRHFVPPTHRGDYCPGFVSALSLAGSTVPGARRAMALMARPM